MAVLVDGRVGVVQEGRAELGATARGDALPLMGYVPPLLPGDLGDPDLPRRSRGRSRVRRRRDGQRHRVRGVGHRGCPGGFARDFRRGGARGLRASRRPSASCRLRSLTALGRQPHPLAGRPAPRGGSGRPRSGAGVRFVSASAYLDLTLPVVRYRVAGIHRDARGGWSSRQPPDGQGLARRGGPPLLQPAACAIPRELVDAGAITAEQAELARDGADGRRRDRRGRLGGHTDNQPARAAAARHRGPARRGPGGARLRPARARRRGGGHRHPGRGASAFAMGAAYVVTGSINQACVESGTSDAVRQMLAKAGADRRGHGAGRRHVRDGREGAGAQAGHPLRHARGAALRAVPHPRRASTRSRRPSARSWRRSIFRATARGGLGTDVGRSSPAVTRAQVERAERRAPKHKLALVFRCVPRARRRAGRTPGSPTRARRLPDLVRPRDGGVQRVGAGQLPRRVGGRRAVVIAKNLLVGAADAHARRRAPHAARGTAPGSRPRSPRGPRRRSTRSCSPCDHVAPRRGVSTATGPPRPTPPPSTPPS